MRKTQQKHRVYLAKWLVGIMGLWFYSLGFAAAFSPKFSHEPLPEGLAQQLITTGMWQKECPVELSKLSLVTLTHYDLLGQPKVGKLIVHQTLANEIMVVFKELYQLHFPIAKVDTLLHLGGDWRKAELNNVSYGFICYKTSEDKFAKPSYGKTISLNPVQNPSLRLNLVVNAKPWYCRVLPHFSQCQTELTELEVLPPAGMFAINRKLQVPGMAEPAMAIFAKQGFKWSGDETQTLTWKQFFKD